MQVRQPAPCPIARERPRQGIGKPGHRRRAARGPRRSSTEGQGIPVIVDVVEELGADAYVYGTAQVHQHRDSDDQSDSPERPFIARVDGRRPPEKGSTVYLAPAEGHIHMFDAENGQRLGD